MKDKLIEVVLTEKQKDIIINSARKQKIKPSRWVLDKLFFNQKLKITFGK